MAEISSVDQRASFLEKKIGDNIEQFRNRRGDSRRWALRTRVSTAVISALVTVFIGLQKYEFGFPTANAFGILTLVLSSSITVIAAWEAFYDNRWMWIRYASTVNALYSISDDLQYMLSRGSTLDEAEKSKTLDVLYQRLQDTLEQTNEEWIGKRSKAAD